MSNLAETTPEEDIYPWIQISAKYKWNDVSATYFTRTLLSPTAADTVLKCEQFLNTGQVESASEKMEELFIKAADIALVTTKEHRRNHPYRDKQKPKKWYNK